MTHVIDGHTLSDSYYYLWEEFGAAVGKDWWNQWDKWTEKEKQGVLRFYVGMKNDKYKGGDWYQHWRDVDYAHNGKRDPNNKFYDLKPGKAGGGTPDADDPNKWIYIVAGVGGGLLLLTIIMWLIFRRS